MASGRHARTAGATWAARGAWLAVAVVVSLAASGASTAGATTRSRPDLVAAPASAPAPVVHRISTIAGGALPGDGPADRLDFEIGGVATSGSYLYVHDRSNHVLRRVDLATGVQQVIAGTGVAGFSGDNGPAKAAAIHDTAAGGLSADSTGVYLVDTVASRVRKVDNAGVIRTIAGTNFTGYWNGDGLLAVNASLNMPSGVAAGGNGVVYIADTENYRVRKIAADGIISTVAGTGTYTGVGSYGDPATSYSMRPTRVSVDGAGNLFVQASTVVVIGATDHIANPQRSAGGHAMDYSFVDVSGSFYFQGGPLCIDLTNSNCVVKRTLDGVDSVVGDVHKSFGPLVALDPTGRPIYGQTRVLDLELSPGTVTPIVGGGPGGDGGITGPALGAALAGPVAVAVDAAGNVVVADENLVKRVTPAGEIRTIAGNGQRGFGGDGGPALDAELDLTHASNTDVMVNGFDSASPGGLAFDRVGNLYLSDKNNRRVRMIGLDGTISTFAGGGGTLPSATPVAATAALLASPQGLAFGPDGSLYIADADGVRKVTPDGQLTTVATGVSRPTALALDPSGNLFVAFSQSSTSGPTFPGGPTPPPSHGYVTKVTPAGATSVWLTGNIPSALATDRDGNLFVGDGDTISKVTPAGVVSVYGGGGAGLGEGGPATAAALGFLSAHATSGPGGMYGQTYHSWATGGGLAADPAGNLFVASPAFLRVRMIEHEGSGFHPLAPKRLVDSRVALGIPGAVAARMPASVHLGEGQGIPASASAVVLNVTVTEGTEASFMTAYPAGQSVPTASNLNFAAGETAANLVTVQMSPDGEVALANARGSTHVVVDLLGWFDSGDSAGDLFTGTTPKRLLDSRGVTGGWDGIPLGSGPFAQRTLGVTGAGKAPAGATGVVLNVTATEATANSFLRVWPAGTLESSTSSVNFAGGETRANLVTVPVGAGGAVAIANAVGATHVVVDLVGWFEPGIGSRFHLFSPRRVLDDRTGTGLSGPWGAGASRPLVVGGANRIPADATAVVANLTATNATAPSFVTGFPHGSTVPTASSINFGPGQTIANLTITQLGPDGQLDLFNQQGGVDLIEDVGGYFSPN